MFDRIICNRFGNFIPANKDSRDLTDIEIAFDWVQYYLAQGETAKKAVIKVRFITWNDDRSVSFDSYDDLDAWIDESEEGQKLAYGKMFLVCFDLV